MDAVDASIAPSRTSPLKDSSFRVSQTTACCGRVTSLQASNKGRSIMAKVCLARPLLSPTEFNGYPLNLLILASALRDSGHEVVVCDYDYLKEIDATWTEPGFACRSARDILDHQPDFVGITALCSNYVLALDLAHEIKRLSPLTHITMGGPHVSLCAVATIHRYHQVDTAVIGEGEVTYPALISAVATGIDLRGVAGIAYRDSDATPIVTDPRPLLLDLSLSPRPAYDLIDIQSYIDVAKSSYFEIYAGSGCPFQCTFCSTSIVWERKYRTMPAQRIVSEIQHLHQTYGATEFNLIHDNLTVNKMFLREVVSEIKARDLHVHWGFSSRIDTLDLATAELAADAGCNYIFFGVESGSTRIQKTMKKRLKLHMIHDTVEYCVASGINPATSFILGFPGENYDDIASTVGLAFQCKLGGARRAFINLLSPYTGTPIMQQYMESLYFDATSVNSTMTSFLEPRHFDTIRADPFIFSNYYSLPYADGHLTAPEYSNLVDFYTICLFRYPCVISYLVNDLGIDPVHLFRAFEVKMHGLSSDDRNCLNLHIVEEDLASYISEKDTFAVHSALSFDRAVERARSLDDGCVVYSGGVAIVPAAASAGLRVIPESRHYLLSAAGDKVTGYPIPAHLADLYELQGLASERTVQRTFALQSSS